MITETMPLNQWPVEKLYALKQMIIKYHGNDITGSNSYEILQTVNSAIKDAEQELSQLPFGN